MIMCFPYFLQPFLKYKRAQSSQFKTVHSPMPKTVIKEHHTAHSKVEDTIEPAHLNLSGVARRSSLFTFCWNFLMSNTLKGWNTVQCCQVHSSAGMYEVLYAVFTFSISTSPLDSFIRSLLTALNNTFMIYGVPSPATPLTCLLEYSSHRLGSCSTVWARYSLTRPSSP